MSQGLVTLVHLSDLHFGRVDERLLDPLVAAVKAAQPRVVVVSGDLTQRARTREFEAARRFLERLPPPRIVVPGNHDVPLYNPLRRVLQPVAAFRRHIEPEATPRHVDANIAVVGINSARALVVKNGRINRVQLDAIRSAFAPLPPEVPRVVVTHHPFDAGEGLTDADRIGRAALAMRTFADCGVDLLLSGHLHTSHSTRSGFAGTVVDGYSVLAVSAGTATSTRVRGEPNEFNLLRVGKTQVIVERQAWSEPAQAFVRSRTLRFMRTAAGWSEAPASPTLSPAPGH
jgi:3',5'-cyclic AMP phosphodiesterase CpdA